MNKKTAIIIAIAIFCILYAGFVKAETGCCLNPYAGACRTEQIEKTECCPADGIYGVQGPANQNECILKYFKTGLCVNADECEPGCCCSPDPSFRPKVECLGPKGTVYWSNFTGARCDKQFCEANANLTTGSTETFDCTTPAPIISVQPIKGAKKVKLIMSVNPECAMQVQYFIVERKTGTEAYQKIADKVSSAVFIDNSPNWDTKYTYKVTAYYDSTHSFPTETEFTTGNLICWHKMDVAPFCIIESYFNNSEFRMYFEGLKLTGVQFDDWIASKYTSYLNSGWYCDGSNIARLSLQCSSGQTCIETAEQTLKCYTLSDCTLGSVSNPFGLFGTIDACEGAASDSAKKYCFFDYSKSVANKCYRCHPEMQCYDYKSEEACTRDNCKANGADGCLWQTYNTELNTGVCKAISRDNCWAVNSIGTGKVESYEAHNIIFNGATQQKLDALNTPQFPCGTLDQATCDSLICERLEQSKCGSLPVKLDNINQVSQGSNLCGGTLKVCTWLNNKCIKDSNGDNIVDCAANDLACQKDHFPPITTMNSWARVTPDDTIKFEITDKTEASSVYVPKQLSDGYELYICAYDILGTECGQNGYNDLSGFYRATGLNIPVSELLRSGSGLKIGSENVIKFFAVDKFKNVEVVNKRQLLVTTYLHDGIGIFINSPKPGWINSKTPDLKFYVDSEIEKIYYINLLTSSGQNVNILDDTSKADYSFDKTQKLNLQEGFNTVTLKIKTYPSNKELTKIFNYTVDVTSPDIPVLDEPEETDLESNSMMVTGVLPGNRNDYPVVEIYLKMGSADFKKIEEAEVNNADGTFSQEILLPGESDYQIKARAKDLAGNTGGFSNIIKFTYVRSAPTFVVDPPNGAVRPFIQKVSAQFKLVSDNIGLDKAASYIRVTGQSGVISGTLNWASDTLLEWTPSGSMSVGTYEIEVNSVDNATSSHRLNEKSTVKIDNVPLITTNLASHKYKVKQTPVAINGNIDGRGEMITNAHINVTTIATAAGIKFLGSNKITFAFSESSVPLVEGENLVLIKATNADGKTAIEPYTIILDTTPPLSPTFSFK